MEPSKPVLNCWSLCSICDPLWIAYQLTVLDGPFWDFLRSNHWPFCHELKLVWTSWFCMVRYCRAPNDTHLDMKGNQGHLRLDLIDFGLHPCSSVSIANEYAPVMTIDSWSFYLNVQRGERTTALQWCSHQSCCISLPNFVYLVALWWHWSGCPSSQIADSSLPQASVVAWKAPGVESAL